MTRSGRSGKGIELKGPRRWSNQVLSILGHLKVRHRLLPTPLAVLAILYPHQRNGPDECFSARLNYLG